MRNIFLCTAMLWLSSCNLQSSPSDEFDPISAPISSYIQRLSATVEKSNESLTGESFWKEGALPDYKKLYVEEDGSFGGIVAGSICGVLEDGRAKALLISQLDIQDVGNEKVIPGVGPVQPRYIADQINSKKPSLKAVTLENAYLPLACRSEIPKDSIFTIRKIDLPEIFQPQSTRIEYRTEACPEGQTGHIVIQTRTIHSKGNVEYQLDDTATQNLCREEKNQNSLSSREADILGVTLTGSSARNSSIAATISNGFAGKKCREVELYSKQEARDDDSEQEPSDGFDTCSGGIGITLSSADWLNDLAKDRARIDCSAVEMGQASRACLADGSQCGELRASPWSGSGTLYRQPLDIKANQWTDWEGTTLQCERSEELIIGCLDSFPWARNLTPLSANNGWRYTRQTTISGWADPARLVPNASQSTSWGAQLASGCSWEETRVRTQSCGANSSAQVMRITERRVFRADTPTIGEWSEWEEVSREGECNAPCDLPWGGTIAHGEYVDAFAKLCDFTNPRTGRCAEMKRQCNNGSLEGPSDYDMPACPSGNRENVALCPGLFEELDAVRYQCETPKGLVYFGLDSLVTSWGGYAHWSALGIDRQSTSGWLTDSETCQNPDSARFGTMRNNCVFFDHPMGFGRSAILRVFMGGTSTDYKFSQGRSLPYYVTRSVSQWSFPDTFQSETAVSSDCDNYPLRDGVTPEMCKAPYTCTRIK